MKKAGFMAERAFLAFNVIEQDMDFLKSKRAIMITMLKLAIVSLQRLVLDLQCMEPTIEFARGGFTDLVELFAELVELIASTGDLIIEMIGGMIIHDGLRFIQLAHYR